MPRSSTIFVNTQQRRPLTGSQHQNTTPYAHWARQLQLEIGRRPDTLAENGYLWALLLIIQAIGEGPLLLPTWAERAGASSSLQPHVILSPTGLFARPDVRDQSPRNAGRERSAGPLSSARSSIVDIRSDPSLHAAITREVRRLDFVPARSEHAKLAVIRFTEVKPDKFHIKFGGGSSASTTAEARETPLAFTSRDTVVTGQTIKPNLTKTLDLTGLKGSIAVWLAGGPGTIDGVSVQIDSGFKTVTADGSTGNVLLVAATTGADSLVGGIGNTTLVGGNGHDTLVAGGGNTVVTTAPLGHADIDFRNARPGATGNVTTAGEDTIWAGAAALAVTALGLKSITVNGGAGSLDFVGGSNGAAIEAGSGNMTIIGGSGKLALDAGAGSLSARLGSGSTTIKGGTGRTTIQGGAGTLDVVGGSGAMSIDGGSGRMTVVAGRGNASLALGTGTATLEFFNRSGGGSETISGFGGKDVLALFDYGPSALASALSSVTSDDHGGSRLELLDGTKIDLLGTSHVKASDLTAE